MSDNPVLTDKDRALFRRAVAGALAAKTGNPRESEIVLSPSPSSGPSPGLNQASNRAAASDDRALFQKAMQGVTPLSVDRRPSQRRRPRPMPLNHDAPAGGASLSGMSDGGYDPAIDNLDEVPEVLWFNRPGLQHLLLRKLRQGRLPIGADLDLHGMIVTEARVEVDRFLVEAGAFGIRCVRIIHGKGNLSTGRRPVLKGLLDRWLRERDEVLAFAGARPEHGGSGAVYVLLRRGLR
jgi:DNA-nicking Smr family endonuclease